MTDLSPTAYLVLGYGVTWLALVWYVWLLGRKERAVEAELDRRGRTSRTDAESGSG